MSEVIEQRQSRDAKQAEAFCDLEAPIRDLERAAKIAAGFFLDDPDEEALSLGRFAIEQFRKLASDLVRLYDERHSAAR
jgi:hypothetical protein